MPLFIVARSCPTLWEPMDYSSPDFSLQGDLQARILEWVVMPSSRGAFQPRDETQVSCIASRFFTSWATRETLFHSKYNSIYFYNMYKNRYIYFKYNNVYFMCIIHLLSPFMCQSTFKLFLRLGYCKSRHI